MRRILVALAAVALVAASGAHGASWAQPQIRAVVAAGLMAPSVAQFRPNDPLTRQELGEILAALTRREQVVVDPSRPVTVRGLDAALVQALGLRRSARRIRGALVAAGLTPPARAGTETVARLLRFRFNHPPTADGLEPLPNSPVTRAETAYSLARVLQLSGWDLARVNELADALALPTLREWERRVLTRSVRFVGYPYVWGGTSERPQTTFGVRSLGGFDCSGFVWRVYKLRPYAGGGTLARTLRGRTTYEMSGEVPRSARIPLARVRPADVVFFGSRGPRSTPAEVGHMGIYLGGGWMVHSSSQGVTLVPLDGWYAATFAWARRPLREAGLA